GAFSMRTITSVGVLSVAKIMGAIYAVIGLILLPFFLLASLIGSMAGGHDNPLGAIGGLVFGLFAPIFYGVLGFVFGAIGAFLYNFMAKWLGGIEVQVQPASPPASIAYVRPIANSGIASPLRTELHVMSQRLGSHYLDEARRQFRGYKRLAEGAIAQLKDEELFITLDPEANSIAVIMKHISGNMRARFMDFITT